MIFGTAPTTSKPESKFKIGDHVKKKALVFAVSALFVAVAVCLAADSVFIGTWKLNEGKSRIMTGQVKNTTVVYTASGDTVTVTTDGTTADGTPQHTVWTGKYDGKDYPATGDPTVDTRAFKLVDDHTLMITSRKAGKVVNMIRVAVSADGKTRTVTTTTTSVNGMRTSSTAVYDKQ